MGRTIKLHGIFENVENDTNNSAFKKVRIKVHGLGKNANKSDITEQAFQNALPSIYGIPIVAKYTEEEDIYGNEGDLTGHNQTIKKDSKGNWKLYYDTAPLGFVSPNTNVYQEDITEPDGNIRTYIIVDNVILWKRYESTQKIIEWLENGIAPKVSMEIGEVDGIVTEDGYFQIDNFEYESICCLGSNVTPCFPRAEIDDLSFSNKNFEELYNEMINEYNSANKDGITLNIDLCKKGGNNVPKQVQSFQLTAEQFKAELINQLSVVKITDVWGWEYSQYSYVDYKDNIVFAFDRNDGYKLVGFEFTTNGDAITINFDTKKRYKFEIVPFDEGQTDMTFEIYPKDAIDYAVKVKEQELNKEFEAKMLEKDSEIENVKKSFEELKGKVSELETFKANKLAEERQKAETELFAKYSELEGIADFEEVKQNSSKFEKIEDLEKEIALIYVKNKANFTKQEKQNNTVKIVVDNHQVEEKPYGDLFNFIK